MNEFEIEAYIRALREDELKFKKGDTLSSGGVSVIRTFGSFQYLKRTWFVLRSVLDYGRLLFFVRFRASQAKKVRFVFTSRNFCTEEGGELQDRIVKPLFTEDIIFVNHSKEYPLTRINGTKVYNLGGVVKLRSLFFPRDTSRLMRIFLAYRQVNDMIVGHLNGQEVFTLCYYDMNGLSLAFSRHRSKMRLVEFQHGSIVNYTPYVNPSPIQIADVFYVKNQSTVEYLKSHLCRDYDAEYRLIPYPKTQLELVPGMHVFYASTIEFNGLHPVFKEFLAKNEDENLHVIVRLHPRERCKEELFIQQLSKYNINYEFDRTKNWIESNRIKNLIVVSPWSSIIEDSFDNGFTTIVIDSVGKERYAHLIDGFRCYYSENLSATFAECCREEVEES